MTHYTSGTCLRCLRLNVEVNAHTGLCGTCGGDPRVRISGGGNNVVVSGSNLTVTSAGGRVADDSAVVLPAGAPLYFTDANGDQIRTRPVVTMGTTVLEVQMLPIPGTVDEDEQQLPIWLTRRTAAQLARRLDEFAATGR